MRDCVFVGNRRFVLEELIKKNWNLTVFVVKGTHLERDFNSGMFVNVPFQTVASKSELLEHLSLISFDLLISNGCPFILPVEKLPLAKYVNIHPSYLPDLKGCDPVIGAVLLRRDAGATCHIMDSGIDTGDIISQTKIPYTEDLDVTTLYQLSFLAEIEVFHEACRLGFKAKGAQVSTPESLYFNRKAEHQNLFQSDTNDFMLQKVKAFNNKSIGCSFMSENIEYKVFRASKVCNPYLTRHVMKFEENTVALSYENSIVFNRHGEVIRFEEITQKDNIPLLVNQKLFGV